jgi:hypothetical protein
MNGRGQRNYGGLAGAFVVAAQADAETLNFANRDGNKSDFVASKLEKKTFMK